MKVLARLIAVLVFASCKPNAASTVKTLDNFAAGKRVTENTCMGSPQVENNPDVIRRVNAVMKQVRPTSGLSDNITASLRHGIAAIPVAQLDAFLRLSGEIHIIKDPNRICTEQLNQITDGQMREEKKSELKTFQEGLDAVDHCYLYLPGLYKEAAKAPPPILVIKNDEAIVKHAVVRVFGFFLSSHLTHIEFRTNGFTYNPEENSAFRETFKRPLAAAFIKDLQDLHRDQLPKFSAYQNLALMPVGARQQFEDFVFAEAFDSFHCNVFSDMQSKNTLFKMMTQFPNTFAKFKAVYSSSSGALFNASTINAKQSKTFPSSSGFGLANENNGGGWFGAVRDFGVGYGSYFKQNAASAYNYTKSGVVGAGTAISSGYTTYSDGLKARTQQAIDGIADSNGGKIGLTGYAKAVIGSTADYNADNAVTAANNASTAYKDYSKHVANTTQGVIDTMESNKGIGNLNALDYTSAVLYASSRQGLGSLSSTVGTSEKLAEAIGGGTYNLDDQGKVLSTEALTVDQRYDRVKEAAVNGARDVLIGEAFAAGSKMKFIGGEVDDVARAGGKVVAEVAEDGTRAAGGAAARSGGKVAAEVAEDSAKAVGDAAQVLCLNACATRNIDMSAVAKTPDGAYKIQLSDGSQAEKYYTRSEVDALSSGRAKIRGSDGEIVHYAPQSMRTGPGNEQFEKLGDVWNGTGNANLADQNFSLSEQAARARRNLEKATGEPMLDGDWQRIENAVAQDAKQKLAANPDYKFGERHFEETVEDVTSGRIAYDGKIAQPKISDDFKNGGQLFDAEGPKAAYRESMDSAVLDPSVATPILDSTKAGLNLK